MSLSRIEVITGMSKFSSLKAALSKAGITPQGYERLITGTKIPELEL